MFTKLAAAVLLSHPSLVSSSPRTALRTNRALQSDPSLYYFDIANIVGEVTTDTFPAIKVTFPHAGVGATPAVGVPALTYFHLGPGCTDGTTTFATADLTDLDAPTATTGTAAPDAAGNYVKTVTSTSPTNVDVDEDTTLWYPLTYLSGIGGMQTVTPGTLADTVEIKFCVRLYMEIPESATSTNTIKASYAEADITFTATLDKVTGDFSNGGVTLTPSGPNPVNPGPVTYRVSTFPCDSGCANRAACEGVAATNTIDQLEEVFICIAMADSASANAAAIVGVDSYTFKTAANAASNYVMNALTTNAYSPLCTELSPPCTSGKSSFCKFSCNMDADLFVNANGEGVAGTAVEAAGTIQLQLGSGTDVRRVLVETRSLQDTETYDVSTTLEFVRADDGPMCGQSFFLFQWGCQIWVATMNFIRSIIASITGGL